MKLHFLVTLDVDETYLQQKAEQRATRKFESPVDAYHIVQVECHQDAEYSLSDALMHKPYACLRPSVWNATPVVKDMHEELQAHERWVRSYDSTASEAASSQHMIELLGGWLRKLGQERPSPEQC